MPNISSSKTRIVLIEDDNKLAKLTQNYLLKHDFEVQWIDNGVDAVDAILNTKPELIILDLMLPGKDGLSICREIRPHYKGGILMLTACDDDMDQVAGLETGADDYVIKPVHPRILLARVRSLLRNVSNKIEHQSIEKTSSTQIEANQEIQQNNDKDSNHLSFGQLQINRLTRNASLNNTDLNLSQAEFDVLELLSLKPNQIFSRDDILKSLRGIEYDGMDRSVDVKISNLRKKLGDDPSHPKKIVTIRGKGYLFVSESFE